MSSWPLLVVAAALAVSSACLAAEPRAAGQQPADAAAAHGQRHLSLDVTPQVMGVADPAAVSEAHRAEAGHGGLAPPAGERRVHLDLHVGRTSPAGRSPGDAPPLFGEVGIDLDPAAGLSLVPSYRVVVDEGDGADGRTIGAQVLKLGARIRF